MDALVTTEWLAAELGARDLCIVDASYFLPEHNRNARAEHDAGHIPGAVFLDLKDVADSDTTLPTMLPPIEKFASRIHALGIGDGCRIVIYDDSPLHSAARAWWMFHAFGTPEVAILDGGLAKWKAEGRPLTAEASEPRLRHFTPRQPAAGVRSLAEMQGLVGGHGVQIVDARSASRFAGTEPETRPGVVPGHIPGSRNLHYADLFHSDGTWKRDITLRAAFEDAGVEVERPIVTTCGSGITAAILVFGAHLLGHEAALYDGSWAEWGGDPATPKATGAA